MTWRRAWPVALFAIVLAIGLIALLRPWSARLRGIAPETRPAAAVPVLVPPTAVTASDGLPTDYPWPAPWNRVRTPYPGGAGDVPWPLAPVATTPTSTPTPAPTPTLPAPLEPGLETLFYIQPIGGETALMCLQLTDDGRPAGTPQDVTPPQYRHPITSIVGSGPGPIGRYTIEASVYALYPSSTGRYVVVVRAAPVGTAIDILDTQEWSTEEFLPDDPNLPDDRHLQFLAWSPDGTHTLLQMTLRADQDEHELWLVDMACGDCRALQAFPPGEYRDMAGARAAFSPDGKHVAVALEVWREPGPWTGEVWLYPVDGGEPKRLADALGRHLPVAWLGWSPQGDTLAMAIQRKGYSGYAGMAHCDLWVVAPDGGSPRYLADVLVGRHAAPAWEPDGSGILCLRSVFSLHRLDVDTRATEPLVDLTHHSYVLAPHYTEAGALLFVTQERYEDNTVVWRQPMPPGSGPAEEILRASHSVLSDALRDVAIIAWLPAEVRGQEDVP